MRSAVCASIKGHASYTSSSASQVARQYSPARFGEHINDVVRLVEPQPHDSAASGEAKLDLRTFPGNRAFDLFPDLLKSVQPELAPSSSLSPLDLDLSLRQPGTSRLMEHHVASEAPALHQVTEAPGDAVGHVPGSSSGQGIQQQHHASIRVPASTPSASHLQETGAQHEASVTFSKAQHLYEAARRHANMVKQKLRERGPARNPVEAVLRATLEQQVTHFLAKKQAAHRELVKARLVRSEEREKHRQDSRRRQLKYRERLRDDALAVQRGSPTPSTSKTQGSIHTSDDVEQRGA